MSVYRRTLALLTARERRRGAVVLALMVAMATLETAGVASVLPFLTVLANPDAVTEAPRLAAVYQGLDFASVDAFLLALGAATFALVVTAALVRTATHYAMNRYVEMRRHGLAERLLETYLRQPYPFFLQRHGADLAKAILSEVDQLTVNVLRPGIQMLAYGFVAAGVVALLAVVQPVLAAGVAALVGGLYALVFIGVRGMLSRGGAERLQANRDRFTAAGEALAGIKDIKLLGREGVYLERFRAPSRRFAREIARSQTLAQVPRFLVEAVGFGALIMLTLVLIALHGGAETGAVAEVVPLIGLYAFGAYRLLPAAQHVYQGLAKLRFAATAVASLDADLRAREALAELQPIPPAPLRPQAHITLERVTFTYPGAQSPTLHGIDVTLGVGKMVAIVGPTGVGKSTLVDLLLGLLRPEEGALCLDGRPLRDRDIPAWQQVIGYVPQHIFCADAPVAENIALGVPREDIDPDRVARCARLAQIHELVASLPEGYRTRIGEAGARLSGGQRQRLAIARALYHDPAVLVLDEATSALDAETEAAILRALRRLAGERTVVLVTHREAAAQFCDRCLALTGGRLASVDALPPGRYPSPAHGARTP